jgi:hypothetical protein
LPRPFNKADLRRGGNREKGDSDLVQSAANRWKHQDGYVNLDFMRLVLPIPSHRWNRSAETRWWQKNGYRNSRHHHPRPPTPAHARTTFKHSQTREHTRKPSQAHPAPGDPRTHTHEHRTTDAPSATNAHRHHPRPPTPAHARTTFKHSQTRLNTLANPRKLTPHLAHHAHTLTNIAPQTRRQPPTLIATTPHAHPRPHPPPQSSNTHKHA